MASFAYSPSRQARVAKLNTIIEDDAESRGRCRLSPEDSQVSPVPSSAYTVSSYYESVRHSNEWGNDDLYDSPYDTKTAKPKLAIRPASGATEQSNRDSWITDTSVSPLSRHQSMVIPSPRLWPTIQKLQARHDLPLTPSQMPISPLSPLALSKLQCERPLPSRTPSLDGSLTSGETVSSIPTTPDVDVNPAENVDWSRVDVVPSEVESECEEPAMVDKIDIRMSTGVQLPQLALSFLQHLSVEGPETPTAPQQAQQQEPEEISEMIEVPLKLSTKPSFESIPQSAVSEYSISELSIPSPGGFFAGLDDNSKHTWSIPSEPVEPNSTVAEQFYNAPWAEVKEQIVEIRDDDTQGPITAMRMTPATAKLVKDIPVFDEVEVKDYDDNYQQDLTKAAEMSMDRTSLWLRAQRDFVEEKLAESPQLSKVIHRGGDSMPLAAKKAVKFLDTEKANKEFKKGPSSSGSDSLFYQAFQHMSNLSSPTDSFTARQARYDAIQARRSSVSKTHIDTVIGNYTPTQVTRPAPQRPISMMPGQNEMAEQETGEQKAFSEAARERDALDQLAPSMWVCEALRYLSGGRLLNSPAAAVLGSAPAVDSIRDSKVRVLDLGGQPSCDWAWHCAREFPHVKTYTATSDPRITAANLKGPSNHRLEVVDNLWTLPFPDNHFDAISARSLFAHLKLQRISESTDAQDQLDACLSECMRVLRPGGYLEFFILDAEVVRGGPRGTAASAEFGFKLRQRGYEPNPTKSWLGRVRRAGFTDIKRAWMFLPMGALRESAGSADMPETPPPRASYFEERIKNTEAVRGPVGSGADVAEVSGLVGSWLWEQWIMKLEMEMGKEKGALGATVGGVVEEGRKTGSGWRSLSGWCQKPSA